MRRLLLTPLFALAAFTLCPAQTAQPKPAAGGGEASVLKFVEEFSDAFSHSDAAALDRLSTADYTFVTPNGRVQDKAQRLAPMKAGALKYESVKYEDVGVRLYGDAAVVVSRVVVKGALSGNDISGEFRSTLTLVKQNGRWLLAASQASAIPKQ